MRGTQPSVLLMGCGMLTWGSTVSDFGWYTTGNNKIYLRKGDPNPRNKATDSQIQIQVGSSNENMLLGLEYWHIMLWEIDKSLTACDRIPTDTVPTKV